MSREKVFNLLKVKGDCWHDWRFEGSIGHDKCRECGNEAMLGAGENFNPDLTTPEGCFWMLKRLPEWERFEEFNFYLTRRLVPINSKLGYDNFATRNVASTLTWLGDDPSNLYKALCGFLNIKED